MGNIPPVNGRIIYSTGTRTKTLIITEILTLHSFFLLSQTLSFRPSIADSAGMHEANDSTSPDAIAPNAKTAAHTSRKSSGDFSAG